MRCPKIVSPSAAIAVAVAFGCFALFLAPCCLAAAAIDTEGLPQELLVPFNDLLPPLSDAELQTTTTTTTTATATTTTTPAPPVTAAPVSKPATTRAPTRLTTAKPTKSATAQKLKKTQYQLDQQLQKQQLVVPILDLNPEVAPALPEAEAPATVVTEAPPVPVTTKAVVVSTPPATQVAPAVTKAFVKVPEPKQAASTQHFQQVQVAQTAAYQELQQHLQPQKQQQYKQKQQQHQQQKQQFVKPALRQPQAQQHRFQPQVAAAITNVTPSLPQRDVPAAATQVNVEQLRHYLEYIYHPTTRRPARGPLPTLTPFPRHLK